jgi:hypothetical protein
MGRRRFDRLVLELSLALDRSLPRYSLWQAVREAGLDPETWSNADTQRFCMSELPRWLRRTGFALDQSRLERLTRSMARFDPSQLTPEEHFARLSD